jgi:hypothetical protein
MTMGSGSVSVVRTFGKILFFMGVICFFVLVFLIRESSADIFAWEYHNCTQRCAPKETCCKETCGYKACIKQNTTRETAIGAELTDPGAADAAMAVCYPHLDVMKKCREAAEQQGEAGQDELARARDEYCTLAAARTRTYANKDACISSTMTSEKNGKLSQAEILNIYRAAVMRLKRK